MTRPDGRTPRAIAGWMARRITSGEFSPGDRLPTVRDVAADLRVSPATVSEAWQALRRAGLVISRGRAGSFVHETPRPWLSPRIRGLAGHLGDQPLDLSRGTPDPVLLPALGPAMSRVAVSAATGFYQDVPVLPDLEAIIRAGWPSQAESLTVVDGAQDAIARTLGVVADFGDRVVVESPGFPPFLDLLDAMQVEVVPVGLDERGIRPEELDRALGLRPVAVVLQPRAQNPTGVSMNADRTSELARVIARHRDGGQVLVIEDDHSGLICSAPPVTLATELPDQVVHVRSFSKSHGPDLRMAALGGPARIIDQVVARRMLGPGWTSRMLQTILLDLLSDPVSVDLVARARLAYAERSRSFVSALGAHGIDLAVPDGINVWVPVADERSALVRMSAAGVRVAGGSPFLAPGHGGGNFVRVTVAALREDFDHVAATVATAAT